MNVSMVAGETVFYLMSTALDEFRSNYPGVYTILLMLEWACNNGLTQADLLRTSGSLKRKWAAPEARGYRLVRGPFDSVAAAQAREWVWRNYGRVSRRLARLSQRHFPSPAPNLAPGLSPSLPEAAS
jgi:CelD/BcsL family acetyltransferase involved in cellulose biosynthesis